MCTYFDDIDRYVIQEQELYKETSSLVLTKRSDVFNLKLIERFKGCAMTSIVLHYIKTFIITWV